MIRRCSKCREHLPLGQFGIKRQRKDGLNLWCKSCVKTSIEARRSTPEGRKAHNEREKARGRANAADSRKRARKWREANLGRAKASNRAAEKKRLACPVYQIWERVRQVDWYRRNAAKGVARANRRRAARIGSTPKWLTAVQRAQVAEFYEIALARQVQTGIRQTVDHIHPLRGENFSGLHVPWNLQIMSHSANSAKANKVQLEHKDQFFEAA